MKEEERKRRKEKEKEKERRNSPAGARLSSWNQAIELEPGHGAGARS